MRLKSMSKPVTELPLATFPFVIEKPNGKKVFGTRRELIKVARDLGVERLFNRRAGKWMAIGAIG